MSLSVFLVQSVVCTTILYGYGFGRADQFTPTVQVVFTITFFALQAAACRYWLNRHPRGPVETLLRRCTGIPAPLPQPVIAIRSATG